jgi:hypothetical protein
LLNAGPAQLDEVDVELADVTAASIGGPHRYQQDNGPSSWRPAAVG